MTDCSPTGNKLFGFYRGQVVLHLTHGYCKIYIPSVYPIEWKDSPLFLPPAEQAASLFAGANSGNGVYTYPNIGSIVWCFFANNDQNYPIYFASSLGGENAFGQYELILDRLSGEYKLSDLDGNEITGVSSEISSTRHMITSGKTHIEWYENGKLSVQVEDPDRRYSLVDYNNSYIGLISDDLVSARPIWQKVANEELSNIHCKLVMDNGNYVNGLISLKTHHYDNANDVKLTNDNTFDICNNGTICVDMLSTYNGTEITHNSLQMRVGSGNTIDTIATYDSYDNSKNNSVKRSIVANDDAALNFNIIGKSNLVDCTIDLKSSTYDGIANYTIVDNKASTKSFIDILTKNGQLEIHINDKGSGHSYITMTKAGVMTIDTTDKVVVHAPNQIQLTSDSTININAGSTINIKAPTINTDGTTITTSGSTVNIKGKSGDCLIDQTSLNKHTHPYTDSSGYIGAGTTDPPDP